MSEVEILDEREQRRSALDEFARADQGGRREAMVPAQMFGAGGDRIVGAQEVAVYRDESKVLGKLKTLAAAAGSEWYYRYPVQNKKENRTDWIEGPSIKLANDLARLYGNCDVDIRVQDLGDSWVFYARFTDFETGFSLTRPFQQSKTASRLGGADEARRRDIAFQIGVSKAERNVVVNALQTFADFAFEEAKEAIVEKIGKRIDQYRERVASGLASQNIDLGRAEAVVGRKLAEWTAPDVAKIIAIMKAVADNMATWDDSLPRLDAAVPGGAVPAPEEKKPGLDEFAGAAGAGDSGDGATAASAPKGEAEAGAPPPGETGAASPTSAREDAPGTTDAPDPAAAALSDTDRGRLRAYSDRLAGAMSEKKLDAESRAFWGKTEPAGAIAVAAATIRGIHADRIAETISAADADNRIKAVLA